MLQNERFVPSRLPELKPPKLSDLEPAGSTRSRDRGFAAGLMSPLGAACLAIATLGTGLWIGSVMDLQASTSEAEASSRVDAEELREARSALALQVMQVDRLKTVHEFSSEHDIPADLAADIYDFAIYEGLRPQVAFRLVKIESAFRRTAVSSAGAVGYTQIKPSTARWLEPSVTYEQLFDTRTNLRLGFRYLSMLMERYDGDERLALLAYNRGPGRVGGLLARGADPANGYARRILDAED